MKLIQRYEWEDALIDAQASGLIPNGALLVCLKLAKVIKWKPDDGKPSGLYWANTEAFRAAGISRTSFYDHREVLLELGFLTVVSGNLIPLVPEVSAVRTQESALRTPQSVVRTEKSAVRNTYSGDIYTVDKYSEDISTVGEPVAADASPVSLNKEESLIRDVQPSPNNELAVDPNPVGDLPESVVRTQPVEAVKNGAYYMALKKQRPLTQEEKDAWSEIGRAYKQAQQEKRDAARREQLVLAGVGNPDEWDKEW